MGYTYNISGANKHKILNPYLYPLKEKHTQEFDQQYLYHFHCISFDLICDPKSEVNPHMILIL